MSKIFSHSREFDFIRIDGLRRATGRPPHEWDFYILKELIDNALDADETLWRNNVELFPDISITIEYVPVPQLHSQQLFVEVSNRALFPTEQIQDIFDTMWYTSRKAFLKGLTRGALGNALKTLLGIPYALRNRVAGDWRPTLKPLSICCKDTEFLPHYIVDSLAQPVKFKYETQVCRPINRTLISLGLDHFEQEKPRAIQEIALLAQQYYLCNPHAQFSWSVVINGQEWKRYYRPDPSWISKFRGIAPINWYSLTAFQDVLGALYRKKQSETGTDGIDLEHIYESFASPNQTNVKNIISLLGQDSIRETDIVGSLIIDLYRILQQNSPTFDTRQLGCIGAPFVEAVLTNTLPVDGEIFYATRISDDPDTPFVIEAAVASLKEGKRQLWTAINFSPTYDDPFQSRQLRTLLQPDEPVLGLRGFLDAYGFLEDSSIIVLLHLICPNIEHHEFSKTAINHLPFKKTLSEVVGKLLTALQQNQEGEELQLEQTIYQILTSTLSAVDKNERFVLSQLLEKVYIHLQKDPAFTLWLTRLDAQSRLQAYIAEYLSNNAVLAQSVAHPTLGMITIPLHPDRHFFLSTEHISQEFFAKHFVNKILYITERELEPVIIENRWLCRLDMALLHNPQSALGLRDVLLQCAMKSNLPIMIWHNADDNNQSLLQQILNWFQEHHLDTRRIVDLGLSDSSDQPTRLLAMMPGEQIAWLTQRLSELHMPIKALPEDQQVRIDIYKELEGLLFARVVEHLRLNTLPFFINLDQQLQITATMMSKKLDMLVKERLLQTGCVNSYKTVLEAVVEEFFAEIIYQYSAEIAEFLRQLSNTDTQ